MHTELLLVALIATMLLSGHSVEATGYKAVACIVSELYKLCGNEVTVTKAGGNPEIVCCGQPMEKSNEYQKRRYQYESCRRSSNW